MAQRVFFVSGDRYARFNLDPAVDRVEDGYPKPIGRGWSGIADIGFDSGIDAGMENGEGKLYLFRGDSYIRISTETRSVDAGYPLFISEQWPGLVDHGFADGLDAVINTNDGSLWFFKGDRCIEYGLVADHSIGEPLPIGEVWQGTSWLGFDGGIDAASTDGDGKVYLFQNTRYVRLDAITRRVDEGYPLEIAPFWNGLEDAGFVGGAGFLDAAWNTLGPPHESSGAPVRDQRWYLEQKRVYRDRAYQRAFGGEAGLGWDPENGFELNRRTIVRLYDYYAGLYTESADRLLWAGLGRLAGAAILSGLDLIVQGGESPITRRMVRIGKDIFEDLAWQHEAFLADPVDAIALGFLHDRNVSFDSSYGRAWEQIASGNPANVAAGNRDLLRNEQFTIIQPHYDFLRASEPEFIGRTGAFTRNIHPYHRDFLTAFPQADIINPDDRWAWIDEPNGMLPKWTVMPPGERQRLVDLPMDTLIRQDWGPTIPELLPPGSL